MHLPNLNFELTGQQSGYKADFFVIFAKTYKMKRKLLPLFALAVLATGFTSCKKDFKCACTFTDDNNEEQTEIMNINGRRPEASLSCEAFQASYNMYVGGAKCKLK